MLPIVLPQEDLEVLHADALTGEELEVDLEKQVVRRPGGKGEIPFQVEEFRRHCLINGLDDIARKYLPFRARSNCLS
jgi:3-isopropylmalate dehydratase